MSEWMVELDHVSKAFGGIRALVDVSLRLKAGEVHALVGENGAGKSTLMNILGGVLQPDSGEIRLRGEPVRMTSPAVAQELGIGLVHQEIALCQDISVAENILMASTNKSRSVLVDYAGLKARAQEVMNRLAPIPVDRRVERLSISNQQLVEIAKALTLDCRVLIFDEPTAALTEAEARTLFDIIRGLKAEGISIIYISHRMAEIFELCDRVTVLRDGHYVGTDDIAEVTPESVVNSMVGREITQLYPPKLDRPSGRPLLTAQGVGDGVHFEDVDLELREGEILGIAGLIGSGRTEIAEGLCGLRPLTTGSVTLLGDPLKARSYADSIDRGLVYLSEDRKGSGIFLDLSIAQNISALDVDKLTVGGIVLSRSAEARQAEELARKLNIKMGGIRYPVSSLSGGNQQKVAIAKQLSVSPRVIILDEPTRGIDVGAKTEIHRLLRELAESGIGILVISSELPEVLGLCDRVLVISEGRVAGELGAEDMTEEAIMHLASGLKNTDNNASTKANPHAAQ